MPEKTPGELKVEQFKASTRYHQAKSKKESCGTCGSFIKIPHGQKTLSKCKQIGLLETDVSDVSASGSCAAWHNG